MSQPKISRSELEMFRSRYLRTLKRVRSMTPGQPDYDHWCQILEVQEAQLKRFEKLAS